MATEGYKVEFVVNHKKDDGTIVAILCVIVAHFDSAWSISAITNASEAGLPHQVYLDMACAIMAGVIWPHDEPTAKSLRGANAQWFARERMFEALRCLENQALCIAVSMDGTQVPTNLVARRLVVKLADQINKRDWDLAKQALEVKHEPRNRAELSEGDETAA